jgi:hypothetical protein
LISTVHGVPPPWQGCCGEPAKMHLTLRRFRAIIGTLGTNH